MARFDEPTEVNRLLGAAGKISNVRYCGLVTAAIAGGIRSRPMGRVPRGMPRAEVYCWSSSFNRRVLINAAAPRVQE